MHHFSWIYTGYRGGRFRVGGLHSHKSGHLLVYCNAKIIIIDFKVLQNAEYSFFLEDDLCELKIARIGKKFDYTFEINKETDTPKNRLRRQEGKKDLFIKIALAMGLIITILFIWYLLHIK